jgi:uncharacterized protein YaeQ
VTDNDRRAVRGFIVGMICILEELDKKLATGPDTLVPPMDELDEPDAWTTDDAGIVSDWLKSGLEEVVR